MSDDHIPPTGAAMAQALLDYVSGLSGRSEPCQSEKERAESAENALAIALDQLGMLRALVEESINHIEDRGIDACGNATPNHVFDDYIQRAQAALAEVKP